jgi:hypothetical protein
LVCRLMTTIKPGITLTCNPRNQKKIGDPVKQKACCRGSPGTYVERLSFTRVWVY